MGTKKVRLSGILTEELCFILILLCIYHEVKTDIKYTEELSVIRHNIVTKLCLKI